MRYRMRYRYKAISYTISHCDIACDIVCDVLAISHAISYAMSHAIICFQVAGPARGLGKFCFQPRALQSRLRENALFYHRAAVPQHQRRRIKQRESAPARQILIHRLGWRHYPRPRLQFRRPPPPHQYHRALAQGGQQGTGSTTR